MNKLQSRLLVLMRQRSKELSFQFSA